MSTAREAARARFDRAMRERDEARNRYEAACQAANVAYDAWQRLNDQAQQEQQWLEPFARYREAKQRMAALNPGTPAHHGEFELVKSLAAHFRQRGIDPDTHPLLS